MYKGKVLRSESLDPRYTVKFSFSDGNIMITDGKAVYERKNPIPGVTFDEHTEHVLESCEVDSDTLKNIKLEIGKTVLEYMLGDRS